MSIRPTSARACARPAGVHYAIPWPRRELTSQRGLRQSPLYASTAARGAVFGQKFGWERPLYFAATPAERSPLPTFGRPGWHGAAAREHIATRTGVSMFDQSSFAKFTVTGRDAPAVMDRLCGARMDVPVGRVVYTPMLNKRGGYESDITVTRTGPASYFVVSGSSQATRDADWMRRCVTEGEEMVVQDVTAAYAVLGVMGPRSRELLSRACTADLSNAGFPFSTSRAVDICGRSVTAARVTYVGELGWELYVPVEFAAGVADALRGAADAPGSGGLELRDAGYYALDSLRVEKGCAHCAALRARGSWCARE
jgi:heterotetrameric sarcosine oxidase gamma subunit